ncbi:hypothetical protein MODO_2618 [Myroides odoratimimus]|nr:hypothetical protein MODO_2618 [Myroides odoratimimus]
MVQLKGLLQKYFLSLYSIFQYLYGAVKRKLSDMIHDFSTKFQYLYGAVKSREIHDIKKPIYKASQIYLFLF